MKGTAGARKQKLSSTRASGSLSFWLGIDGSLLSNSNKDPPKTGVLNILLGTRFSAFPVAKRAPPVVHHMLLLLNRPLKVAVTNGASSSTSYATRRDSKHHHLPKQQQRQPLQQRQQLTRASTISPSSLSRVCLSSETAFLRLASSSRTKDWNFSSPFILDRTFSSRIRRRSAYVSSREVYVLWCDGAVAAARGGG